MDLPEDGREAEARVHRRRPRVDRRQPVHLPRHEKGAVARLEAEAHDPAGGREDGGVPPGQPVAVPNAMTPTTLQGKCAFVTGASRGLGLEIARRLFNGGAHVMMVARDGASLAAACNDLPDPFLPGQHSAWYP